jgi:hypothetical protein
LLSQPSRITYEPWAELQIPQGNRGMGGVGKVVRGKHWQFPVIVPGAMTEDAVWAIIEPAFLANGWTAVHEWAAGAIELLLHYQKDGVEAWAETDLSGSERASVEIVEIAPMPFKFTLTAPSATPEPVDPAAGDFPWLGPLPGSKFRSSAPDTAPFCVPIKGASEPVLQQILDLLKKNPSLKRVPRLSSSGSHSMGSPATGLQPKALARPGRLQITQPTRAEQRIAASRLPTRIAPHIRSRLRNGRSGHFLGNSLALGIHARFWLSPRRRNLHVRIGDKISSYLRQRQTPPQATMIGIGDWKPARITGGGHAVWTSGQSPTSRAPARILIKS